MVRPLQLKSGFPECAGGYTLIFFEGAGHRQYIVISNLYGDFLQGNCSGTNERLCGFDAPFVQILQERVPRVFLEFA